MYVVHNVRVRAYLYDSDYATLCAFQMGMMVRCCKTYEEVVEGDFGKVTKVTSTATYYSLLSFTGVYPVAHECA